MAPPPTAPSFLRPPPLPHHTHARLLSRPPSASFRVSEILGGRGLCNGEVGLKDFVAKNPPPPKNKKSASSQPKAAGLSTPPRTPELPLFLPGMVVLVKNPNNAYHMYCGIVQRVTDGKVAVLFEGGNWDRLITFNLDELEGREKGPPMVNPKSVVLEDLISELDDDDDKEDEAAKKEKEPEASVAAA
ncbi:unnamed protein product [Urochloa decumbens]|uniref:NAD(P)H-quinone oxidoreductase subunit S, chloroplastic n=1 Tax=Urochloa decumbens TaxID=240449 RepID=A0ABC8WWH5_9POAL